jgi:hypothetical protein
VEFLGAAVSLAIVLCLVDLLLTFGVIRRLREHSELLSRYGSGAASAPVIGLAEGTPPGRFTATATDGLAVHGPDGLRIAGFFSTTCPVCPERVPGFIEYLRVHRVPRDAALAVIVSPSSGPPPYLNELAVMARVCLEPPQGDVAAAFQVQGFPAFCLLDDAGTIRGAGYEVQALPKAGLPVR